MPIEEKPQLLEFDCTVPATEKIKWNVKYDPNDQIGLHISGNGQEFLCPVELLGDITAFLQSKNIIKPNIYTRGRTVSTPGLGPVASSLMPPNIEGQDNTPLPAPVNDGPPMDALASFDITNGLEAPKVVTTDVPGTPTSEAPVSIPSHAGAGSVAKKGVVITPDTKSEISNRPVIRTRVNSNDPQSAEKEGAAIRGSGKAGGAKAVKKRHQIVE